MDGVAPVDAQNASTSRLENPHSTRVSHTAHAHHFFGRKKDNKDNDLRRTRLAMGPGISNSLTGRLQEDLSEGLWNYLRANTCNRLQVETSAQLDALLPAILDRAFKGEL